MNLSSKKIRNDFIRFFEEKQHKFVRSAPVKPIDDPTLLFTNAGMNQFKNIFLGNKSPDYTRVVNSQKCIRVSGKHNDLEEVGVDSYHHTFFEMLGNWSFGDYYKKEAIIWSWELLTEIWKLDKDRLWVTIYKDDDESGELWKNYTDINPSRILKFGNKDNFWEMGETGPCGPCSEIHYYVGDDIKKQSSNGVNNKDEYRELWNLVFIQYNRNKDGKLDNLKFKYVDTGLGLERISATLNNLDDHYLTDLFKPLIDKIITISKKDYSFKSGVPHRVIADHLRMISFSLSDGIMPSNEGQGYVVRRVLRRAVRFGRVLGIENEFLYLLINDLIDIQGETYPELVEKRKHIENVIKSEEKSFGRTLDRGLHLFEEISNIGKNTISGEDVFKLYDTYGFPLDLTELLASEKKMKIDKKKFEFLMSKQKEKGRSHNKFKSDVRDDDWVILDNSTNHSIFIGYEKDKTESKIIKYRISDVKIELVLKETPFYAESGGQVGDTGIIKNDKLKFLVENTYKIDDNICHYGTLKEGKLEEQKDVKISVEINSFNRLKIKSNHTATHLLHKALKNILGEHVQQAGSLVDVDRLRFDLTHYQKISNDEIISIEESVNSIIRKNINLNISIKDFNIAKKEGAEALFGEKYGDEVRVIDIKGFSKELCGGTHVKSTGDIGLFKIISETSLASGVRRIEALTGKKALSYLLKNETIISNLKIFLNCKGEEILNRVDELNINVKEKNDLIKKLMEENIKYKLSSSFKDHLKINNGIRIFTYSINEDFNPQLLADNIREQLQSNGIALISINSNITKLLCVSTKDISKNLQAGIIIKKIATELGLKGGGSKFFGLLSFNDNSIMEKAMNIGLNIINKECGCYDS